MRWFMKGYETGDMQQGDTFDDAVYARVNPRLTGPAERGRRPTAGGTDPRGWSGGAGGRADGGAAVRAAPVAPRAPGRSRYLRRPPPRSPPRPPPWSRLPASGGGGGATVGTVPAGASRRGHRRVQHLLVGVVQQHSDQRQLVLASARARASGMKRRLRSVCSLSRSRSRASSKRSQPLGHHGLHVGVAGQRPLDHLDLVVLADAVEGHALACVDQGDRPCRRRRPAPCGPARWM